MKARRLGAVGHSSVLFDRVLAETHAKRVFFTVVRYNITSTQEAVPPLSVLRVNSLHTKKILS